MNVLVLTDLSEVAKNAGEYAVNFLANVPVNFHLLNVGVFNEDLKKNGKKERENLVLNKINKRIAELQAISTNKEHFFAAIYSEDNLVSAARRYAEEKKVDLIIMGAAQRGFSPNTIVGNFTYEIIKKIKCNLLAIPEGCRYSRPKKMMIPVDFSASLDEKVFHFLEKPGIVNEAEISIMAMKDENTADDSLQTYDFRSRFPERQLHFAEITRNDLVKEEVLAKVQKDFDLIVLLAKNLRVCDRFLHTRYGIYSSVSNKLPILVLHG